MSSNVLGPSPSIVIRLLRHWPEGLVLAGVVALVAGFWFDRTWEALPSPGRYVEIVVIGAVAMVAATVLRTWRGWSIATGLAIVAGVAGAVFAGVQPMLATLLLALAAVVLGRLVTPGWESLPVGLALVAGGTGWLLPLSIHHQWVYLLFLGAVVVAGRRVVSDACRAFGAAWRDEVASAPAASAWAMLLLLVASAGCWLPTMQFDDLAYHLGLPFQLQDNARYAIDPTHQVWALAPWAGDVLHGIAQVSAGTEARGALNLLWLVAGAAGIHRLSALLGAPAWARWGSVALFATLPLTAALVAGMQTELPGAVVTLALACLVVRETGNAKRNVLAGGVLVGMLFALKLMHAATALPLLAWAAWRHRRALGAMRLATAAAATAVVGGSSYAYAWFVAGNPVLPLLNATFGSSFYPARNFLDERWQHGLDAGLPWALTFDTAQYFEGFDGALGLALVGAAGAWLLALLDGRTRGLAAAATGGLLVALLPMQYARYLYPSLVLLLPALVVATARALPHWRAITLVAALSAGQLAFYGSGFWMVRGGAVRDTILAMGDDAPLLQSFAPERVLAARIRQDGDARVVLPMQTEPDALAELGTRGRTASWYSHRVGGAGWRANRVPDGSAWVALLQEEQVTDVILRDAGLTDAQRAGLARVGAHRIDAVGPVEWWRIPGATP